MDYSIEIARSQRLLRQLDMEALIEDLGIIIDYQMGYDIYAHCPDPNHIDRNPSFHICCADEEDAAGENLLGYYNCWSHPDNTMSSRNFLNLVAKILYNKWDRIPNARDLKKASTWIRQKYNISAKKVDDLPVIKLPRPKKIEYPMLDFPKSIPIRLAQSKFRRYLEKRHISLKRANELDVGAVENPGDTFYGCLRETVPGIIFPIRWRGKIANWFVRSILRVQSRYKARYAPKMPLGKHEGILWAPDGCYPHSSKILVEGILDAERVRQIVKDNGFRFEVNAVLGGQLHEKQALNLFMSKSLIHLADGDHGGLALSKSILQKLPNTDIVMLPDGMDPNDVDEKFIFDVLNNHVNDEKLKDSSNIRIKSYRG